VKESDTVSDWSSSSVWPGPRVGSVAWAAAGVGATSRARAEAGSCQQIAWKRFHDHPFG